MNIAAEQASFYLQNNPLPPITLISGSEALLNIEALDACRQRALADGFSERQRLEQENLSQLILELESPSLFAEKKLIEVNIQDKKLNKSTTEILLHLADLDLSDSRLILFLPNAERVQLQNWFKTLFEKDHLALISKTLYPNEFERYIRGRIEQANLAFSAEAHDIFLNNCYGNLLAAKQAIDRLTIHPAAKELIDAAQLTELLNDCAQFNTFSFSEAVLAAKWLKAYRISLKLEAEAPNEGTLITWLLQRDATLLLSLHNDEKMNYNQYFKQYNIYKTQQGKYIQALRYHRPSLLRSLLRLAAKLDRIVKGDESGNFWLTLSQYLLLRAQA